MGRGKRTISRWTSSGGRSHTRGGGPHLQKKKKKFRQEKFRQKMTQKFMWEGLYLGGMEDLHLMSSEKKMLISLISLFKEVMEVMGSWKL